jgi:predicted Zn finger-like uncharacterized protein
MSSPQATRCPNCATVFRVATAQLEAYEGWVRCGRCAEVFNAESCLVELDTPPAPMGASVHGAAPSMAAPAPVTSHVDFDLEFDIPATSASPPPPPPLSSPLLAAASTVKAGTGLAPAYQEDNMVERAVKAMRTPSAAPAAMGPPPAWPRPVPAQPPVAPDFGPAPQAPEVHSRVSPLERGLGPVPALATVPDSQVRIEPAFDTASPTWAADERPVSFTPAALADDSPTSEDITADPRWQPYNDASPVPAVLDVELAAAAVSQEPLPSTIGDWRDQPPPSFVQKADRAARWRSPKIRWALTGVCLASLLSLLLQAAHEYRDIVAARLEVTRPLLERGCALMGCQVGAPRALDADGVSVESSGLVRVEKTSTYKLNIALRNRASMAVAVPALELSLTDAQGKLMVRRVLRASDFAVAQSSVPAGRELNLQATLQTAFAAVNGAAQEPVAGYTIELFYP